MCPIALTQCYRLIDSANSRAGRYTHNGWHVVRAKDLSKAAFPTSSAITTFPNNPSFPMQFSNQDYCLVNTTASKPTRNADACPRYNSGISTVITLELVIPSSPLHWWTLLGVILLTQWLHQRFVLWITANNCPEGSVKEEAEPGSY